MTQRKSSKLSMITIVIVNYNTRKDLSDCLEGINTASPSFEYDIIVIDNNSTDGSREMVKSRFPNISLIENETNDGLTKGYNRAFRFINTPLIVLLDSDTIIEPGALDKLYAFLISHPDAGIVAPKMLYEDRSIQITARSFPSAINALFGRQSSLTRLFPNNRWSRRYLRTQYINASEPLLVDWVSFACTMFRTELLKTVGSFDEDYFVYWVDADWCKRVKDKGYNIYWFPRAEVVHKEKFTRGKKKRSRSIIDFHKGCYLYYRKHYAISAFNPMTWVAFFGLSARAAILLIINNFRR